MIGIRVLGRLEVIVDGTPVTAGGPKQRCVLARLVAARGQVVSADRLIEDLYAGEAPPRALAAVQSYVSHLRRVLEPGRAAWTRAGCLVASAPGYALLLDPAAVDAWAFEDAVHRAAGLDDPAAVNAALSPALASWRGAAFQEFGDLPWAGLEASRLEELRLGAVEMRAGAVLRLGRPAQVVADLDKLAAEHPLREESWRLLALALYQSGRQGDALAALRRAKSRLAAELGIDPGPALRELEADILAQAPRLVTPAVAFRTPTLAAAVVPANPAGPARERGSSAAVPYVGRDTELAQVLGAAAEAAAGQPRVILVTGDAGAGKTALTDRVSQRLTAEGWAVTAGRCPEDEGAPAGWPWAQALRDLALAVPPSERRALAALLTDAPVPEGDVAAARFRLHQAVGRYLAEVSRAVPLLVVLDDLHRADSETLAILVSVAASPAGRRILLVAAYRPTEAGELLKDRLGLLAGREPTRVALRGLDEVAAGELIRATCTRAVDDATIKAITERAGGNPFFLRETARLVDSEGAAAAATGVPAGVGEVLRRRIGRLPATAQTVLRQAAVIGTETEVSVLGDAADVDEHVLLDAIEAGLIAGLVTEPTAGRVRFTHALIRDTLYQGLSRLRRSRLHGRAARAIERHQPGEVAALAYHYAEAGTKPALAARYCRMAAERAEQRFAYREAAGLWEQAFTFLDQVGSAPVEDRIDLALGLVRTLALAGELERARRYRRNAVRTAIPLGDQALLGRAIVSFDVPRLWPIHPPEATDRDLVAAVEQALGNLPPGDHPLRCRLLTTLAFELDGDGSDRGYQASTQAMEMGRRIGDPAVLTMAISGRYIQTFRGEGLSERLSLGAELLALPGKPVNVEALARQMLMGASCGAADFGAADLHADEVMRIAGQYDLPVPGTWVGFYRAMRTALSGDAAAARERYEHAAAEMDRLGMWGQGRGLSILGRLGVAIMQDETAEIAEVAGELGSFYDGYPSVAATIAGPYALALARSGQVARARAVAVAAGPIRPNRWRLLWSGIRGLLAIAIEDPVRAESAYQALLPYAAQPAGADTAVVTLWPTAQILGDLAGYLRLPGTAAHYRQALAVAERAHVQPWRQAADSRLRALAL